MQKTISTLTFLFVLFLSTCAFGQRYDVVYVRVIETFVGGHESHMQVTYSDGQSERQTLDMIGKKGEGGASNAEKIAKQIKKLLDQGFTLTSHSNGGTEFVSTTMIFTKAID